MYPYNGHVPILTFSVITSIQCDVFRLLRMPHAKKPLSLLSSTLVNAGCSRRIQYASSGRRRRLSHVEQSIWNLILGFSVSIWCWLTWCSASADSSAPFCFIFLRYSLACVCKSFAVKPMYVAIQTRQMTS